MAYNFFIVSASDKVPTGIQLTLSRLICPLTNSFESGCLEILTGFTVLFCVIWLIRSLADWHLLFGKFRSVNWKRRLWALVIISTQNLAKKDSKKQIFKLLKVEARASEDWAEPRTQLNLKGQGPAWFELWQALP